MRTATRGPRGRRWALAVGLVVGTAAVRPASPAPLQLRVERAAGMQRADVVVPGVLVSYALPARMDGGRDLALLVRPGLQEPAPGEGSRGGDRLPPCPVAQEVLQPLALYRLDPLDGDGELTIHTELPRDATALEAADLDGDGAEELLVLRPGELLRITGDGVETVLTDPELNGESLHPWPARGEAAGPVPFPLLGATGVRLLGPAPNGPGWRLSAPLSLPLDGTVRGGELAVRTPALRFVGRRSDGTMFFATPTEAAGERRLRTLLLQVGPGGETAVVDAWLALPYPEAVLEEHFLMLDDAPALLVTARPTDRLNVLGEKYLRLFPVERDRSRLGLTPRWMAQSRVNLWQPVRAHLLDVNGDGRDDLVIGYWKGLLDERVVLDAYLRDGDGSFRTSPRTTAFDVKNADTGVLRYGADLDGDGLPDLLLIAGYRLRIHRGLPTRDGGDLVDRAPFSLPNGSWERQDGHQVILSVSPEGDAMEIPVMVLDPRMVDLDGDGASEILMAQRGGGEKPGALRILRVRR